MGVERDVIGPIFAEWNFMMGLSLPHLIILALVVVLLFGRGRISEMMGDFGKGIKSFKKGINDDANDAKPAPPPPQIPSAQIPPAQSSEQPVEGERTGSDTTKL